MKALTIKIFFRKLVGDIHFVEERRKALERYLNIVARHPIISADSLIYFFLTARNDVRF